MRYVCGHRARWEGPAACPICGTVGIKLDSTPARPPDPQTVVAPEAPVDVVLTSAAAVHVEPTPAPTKATRANPEKPKGK